MRNANSRTHSTSNAKDGRKTYPLERVYRSLFSEDLFLTAYDKIARNKGALTAGSEAETQWMG